MNSSPWLAVAVYVRAPVADAPMATDIAANSESTLMNSRGSNRPVFTSAESASTMWVCGEIGYAAMTSGRQKAIASATALDPSICLGMDRLQQLQARRLCRGRVGLADRAGEALADRRRQRARRRDSR